MSGYALDEGRNALVVYWSTGVGDTASTVTQMPAKTEIDSSRQLAAALTRLSTALWRTYTHPASAAGDPKVANTEAWRRQHSREAFADVIGALKTPNLPTDGRLVVSYDPVEESAHSLGRALHALGSEELTERIVQEAGAEIEAVEHAELGDLSGRARQAVMLTRADASPAQVAASNEILEEAPLAAHPLFVDVDPCAASVAAAHWLQAAADVTAEVSGVSATAVVREADNIQALPHETPTLVLELMAQGERPYDAVVGLIRKAMLAAEGGVPDPNGIRNQLDEVDNLALKYHDRDPHLRESLIAEIRTTPLDPRRPAPDLLEDLLEGIHGCWLLYQEYADDTDDADIPADDDEATDGRRADAGTETFLDEVRLLAALDKDRL